MAGLVVMQSQRLSSIVWCSVIYRVGRHIFVQLEGHSSSGCSTPARHHFSCLMKVIIASSKCCNKVCELFEQCMSEYWAGVGTYLLKETLHGYILSLATWMCLLLDHTTLGSQVLLTYFCGRKEEGGKREGGCFLSVLWPSIAYTTLGS